MNSEIINSERLGIRVMQVSDAETVFCYRNLKDVALFQDWTPASVSEVIEHAKKMAGESLFEPGEWWQLVLVSNTDSAIIGDIAVCIDQQSKQQAELGIALDPQFQKKGYASEALTSLIGYLFRHHQLHRIHVSIDPRNIASLNLFSRIGFRQEAHHRESYWFKGEWVDDIIMAILSSEWDK